MCACHQAPKVVGSSGKILKSGPDDRVFVYYADHGAPGMHPPSHYYLFILQQTLSFHVHKAPSPMAVPSAGEVWRMLQIGCLLGGVKTHLRVSSRGLVGKAGLMCESGNCLIRHPGHAQRPLPVRGPAAGGAHRQERAGRVQVRAQAALFPPLPRGMSCAHSAAPALCYAAPGESLCQLLAGCLMGASVL
jgi:hypothetical protein